MALAGSLAARAKCATVELAATFAKAVLAISVFSVVTSGYAHLRAGRSDLDLMSQPLPNAVESACSLWFIGSSSMSRWTTLEHDMRPWVAHNRAIGGATLDELSSRFAAERSPMPPRAIVFYAGDNDLAYGVPEAFIVQEFRTFLDRKAKKLGRTPVFFVSVKPSPTRWRLRPAQARYNEAVRRLAAERTDLFYVDIVPGLFRAGRLGPFYDPDGIHMNTAGYEIWSRAVRRALRADLPTEVVRACDRRA